jgi:hypothetical protein
MTSARKRIIVGLIARITTISKECIEPVGILFIAQRPLDERPG